MGLFKKLFMYEYLDREHLNGFTKYKYSSVDNSPISNYLMHPFWNKLVNLYPLWLAPNLLTFTGFLCLIANFILFSIYDYNFYGICESDKETKINCSLSLISTLKQQNINYNLFVKETNYDYNKISLYLCSCIPRVFWLISAICQFLSHHLDGTDGKQARRTGSSSPLGELFDHGLDSWATLFLPVSLYSIFGRSEYGASVTEMYFVLWIIMITFILSHWEKYNTGVLFLPWSYDLCQIAMTIGFLITYALGPEFWHFSLNPIVNVKLVRALDVLICISALGLSIPFSIQNIYNSHKAKTLKQNSIYEAMRPLFSTIYLLIIQTIWIYKSKINIIEYDPRAFYWLTGTLFSNMTCRLIIAQMTATRCPVFNWLLIPLSGVVLNVYFNVSNGYIELYSLYLMCIIVTLSHVHYGICVVKQLCKHFGIYCFVITRKPNKNDATKSN